MDIVSWYPNIQRNEGLSALRKREFAELLFRHNVFCFNEKDFKQKEA